MYINYEWKCMCENPYNREAYLQQKQPTTSHLISFVVAVPTKYFFLSFSLMALPVFFQKKRTHFLIEEGRCCCCFFGVVVGNRKLFAISLFHGRRRYVLTIVIMAQLTCIVCVFASISHSLCACNMTDVVMWKWQFHIWEARCVAYSLKKLKSNGTRRTQCDDRN